MTTRNLLLDALDEAYDHPSWHGPNLRGSLRGLKRAEADWRPSPRRHNIRDIIVHAAFWKYRVRRRLTDDPSGTFALKGSNWFRSTVARTWVDDLKLLADEHRALRAAVASVTDARLTRPLLKNGKSGAWLVRGIAAHDLYHAGQIQLLKRLQRAR